MSATPYSASRRVGDIVAFSGLVGRDEQGPGKGLAGQLALIFEQLDARLAEQGLTRRHVFKTTVWLADMAAWEEMNAPYEAYFAGHPLPARSTVGAQLLPGLLVELEAWADASA